jgi:NDP-sugar pyrophosphorylase family protein
MKAMIFAAGMGTRLKPLTDTIPKALVKVNGETLLEITIKRLKKFGFDQVIVNVHHFAGQIIDFLQKNTNFGVDVSISDESGQLLDTGGGLMKASYFFDDNNAFLVHNVDVISGIDLGDMYKHHVSSGNMITLAVKTRNTERQLLFTNEGLLCGRINGKTGAKTIVKETVSFKPYAFSGIHVIDPGLFRLTSRTGTFSLIDLYLELSENCNIGAYIHEQDEWLDVGKPSSLEQAGIILHKINTQH